MVQHLIIQVFSKIVYECKYLINLILQSRFRKMQQKITHIIFAILIILGSSGMTISKHYCGTSLKSVSINHIPDNCCGTSSDCCHNESITIKLDQDNSTVTTVFNFNSSILILPSITKLDYIEFLAEGICTLISHEGPPPKIQTVLSKLQLYLL